LTSLSRLSVHSHGKLAVAHMRSGKLINSVPLCFIYPAMLHLKACAKTRKAIALDWAFIIFGSAVGLFTTVQTLRSLAEPSAAPSFGKCDVPH